MRYVPAATSAVGAARLVAAQFLLVADDFDVDDDDDDLSAPQLFVFVTSILFCNTDALQAEIIPVKRINEMVRVAVDFAFDECSQLIVTPVSFMT